MINITDKIKCNGCSACANACPKRCISMVADREGFLYPQIDAALCIDCDRCERVCPITARSANDTRTERKAYAAINNNADIRKASSSGGVFTVIAEYVIAHGGVVFGASFDSGFQVQHTYTETVDGLAAFRGSKYVQSRIGDTYKQAKSFLDSGRLVLFSGTPCQIGGLKGFLQKEYDNLICQDIICHGAPSPLAWQKYLDERTKKARSPVKSVSFRDKQFGWKSYRLHMVFENGKEYVCPPSLDPYMRAFLSDFTLRKSCFACMFKGESRCADITLADFWGISSVLPQMDDDTGTSLVLTHTPKGAQLLSNISDKIMLKQADTDAALKYNPSAHRSAKLPADYDSFQSDLQSKSFSQTVEKHCKIPVIRKFKLKLYHFLKTKGLI